MIVYRTAQAEDAAPLAAMARASFTETFGHLYPPEDLATFLDATFGPGGLPAQIGDPRYTIRIALDGDRVAGFAKIGPNAFTDHAPAEAIELYQLYVLQPWQGAGVAATLMEWAIGEARARGAPQLMLSVYVDNLRAQRFYTRYGLREVGRYAFPVGNTIDDDRIWRLDL
jgi:ribosomal protein S18 acetylase RimI-like enzyme